jgi:hypothetical protein
LGTRLTPAPVSRPPETGDIDESWEDLVVGAFGSAPPPTEPEDPDVFDRPTAVPKVPPSGLELDFGSSPPRRAAPAELGFPFGSEPPDSGRPALLPRGAPGDLLSPHSMPTVSPEPGARYSSEADPRMPARVPLPGRGPTPEAVRKHTVPEPLVERNLTRIEAGDPSPVDRLAERGRHRDRRDREEDPMEVSLEPESHSPLDLVETYRRSVANMPAVRGPEPEQPEKSRDSGNLQDMQDRYAVGDFTGALVVAESLLDADPENEDAKRYAQSCREVLTQMYAARIGPMDQVATVAVPPEQITWLSLDHRAGFLLSLVDGVSSIEEILDISGMTRLDALRIMYTLVQQNVIALAH